MRNGFFIEVYDDFASVKGLGSCKKAFDPLARLNDRLLAFEQLAEVLALDMMALLQARDGDGEVHLREDQVSKSAKRGTDARGHLAVVGRRSAIVDDITAKAVFVDAAALLLRVLRSDIGAELDRLADHSACLLRAPYHELHQTVFLTL